jgi:hypothetical protein
MTKRLPVILWAKRLPVILWAICGMIILSPLLWVRLPPLVDYPNHLARMWILAHGAEIPELADNYTVHWRILPNLAMDLIVPPLARAMPIEEAGRVFLALTMLALLGGTVALHRVLHGRLAIWPVWAVLFIYNAALFRGFVNFLFATGIYLFAFSGWIAARHWRTGPRILVFSVAATLLAALHLFAFGLYGLSVISYELANRPNLRRMSLASILAWGAVFLQFVPGILLWYGSLAHGAPTYTAYGNLASKVYALVSPFTFGFQPAALDGLTGSLLILFVIFAILTRSLKLVPEMRLPLAVMMTLALLIPNWLNGSWLADIRLPVALPFVIVASTRFEPSRTAVTRGIAAVAIILLGLRVWTVSQAWLDYDRWFAEFRSASGVITPGARLLVVQTPTLEQKQQLPRVPLTLAMLQWPIFSHLAALTIIDRAAFVPYMFTRWTPIDVTPRNEAVSQSQGVPATPEELIKSIDPKQARDLDIGPNFLGERPYWRNWPATFDFVLWIDFSKAPKPALEQLGWLASGSFFEIYRVVRQ